MSMTEILAYILLAIAILWFVAGMFTTIRGDRKKKSPCPPVAGLLIVDRGNASVNGGVYFQAYNRDPMTYRDGEKILLEVQVFDDSQGKQLS